ncbi:hypothetical protein BCR34DRAFT_608181 [Clohesyomyces aquaticus]|uniref:Fe2OG dioxygenase domain-containing protein n=1 Tax=Clohesyomyces aquaticus TaxID=1231657 RepID=A0A1Y1Y9Y4_9PLEO|nr:hypothetical protein BCR34DRAFT_608181 [Clohesyomyces aquaticus]
MATTFASLPVVDIRKLKERNVSDDDTSSLSKQLYDVFSTTGFAYLVNLPLSFGHDEIFKVTQEFFALDLEEKMRLAKKSFSPTNTNTYRGYFPTQPLLDPDNLKEGFEIGCPDTKLDNPSISTQHRVKLSEPNVWPDATAFQMRQKLDGIYRELQSLAIQILSLLAVSLGKPSDFFNAWMKDSLSTLRLLHYPRVFRNEEIGDSVNVDGVKLSCTPHTDSGILTLLHQDATGGLEVRDASGTWVPAPYVPGSIVVNIGDLMAKVSGERFTATMHRVRAPPSPPPSTSSRESSSAGRYSVPFFFEPGENCVIESVSGEGESVVYGEHLRMKMKTWVEFMDDSGSVPLWHPTRRNARVNQRRLERITAFALMAQLPQFSAFHLALALLLPVLASAQCDIPPLTLVWSNTTVSQDGLGVARGIELGIGSPHQIFAFRPATTLNNTRINNVLNCGSASNDSCIGALGGGFDPSKSKSYSVSIKSQWNGSQVDAEDSTGAYVYFNDDVGFQNNGHVEGFPLVMDSEVFGGSQAGLPLGTNSSFLRAAVQGGVAPSEVFGLWSGSRGVQPHDGLLVVGGYDRARVKPSSNFTTFPVGKWSLERACPLQVTITNLTYANLPLMTAGSSGIDACIEPLAQRFVFPPKIATMFATYTGQNGTLYPNKMWYNVSNRPTGDMSITLSNGYTTTISNAELFAPLRGSDKNGRYAITNDSVLEAFVADNRKANPDDVDTALGGMFLTFNYLLVNYPKGEFGLAPAVAADAKNISPDPTAICTPTNRPAPTQTPRPTPSDSPSKSSTNVGAIAGGVVGGVAGIALLGALAFILFRRRRKTTKGMPSELDPQSPVPVSRQASELMAHEMSYNIQEMPTSRHASFRKPDGRDEIEPQPPAYHDQ